MVNQQPSPALLKKLLEYKPESGDLFWLPRTPDMFSNKSNLAENLCKGWNTKYSKKPAFLSIDNHGYRRGGVMGRYYLAHRVIWAMQTGSWPEHTIDHIDGNKLNNSWSNLRHATHSENCRNKGMLPNNTTGFKGVGWHKRDQKWFARIYVHKKCLYIGYFPTAEEAYAAYCAHAQKLHGSFARFR
jgi:hypothetical protein